MRKNMYKLSQKLKPTNRIDYINEDINNVKINSNPKKLQAINVEVKDYGFKGECILRRITMELIMSNLLILSILIIFIKYNQTKNINATSDKKIRLLSV